jgi:hypothetical protein
MLRFAPLAPLAPRVQRLAHIRPDGETGRRKGLKIPRPQGYAGSIPALGTNKYSELMAADYCYGITVFMQYPIGARFLAQKRCVDGHGLKCWHSALSMRMSVCLT